MIEITVTKDNSVTTTDGRSYTNAAILIEDGHVRITSTGNRAQHGAPYRLSDCQLSFER